MTIDGCVGSHSQGHCQQGAVRTIVLAATISVVLQVVGIGQREVGREADAVRHVVVQHQARGQTVHLLLDDRTRLVVVAGRDTEGSLLSTTRDVEVGLVLLTKLLDGVNPIGVLVPVVGLGPRLGRHVVDFVDGRGGRRTLRGVVELFLEHHGVVVTIQQIVAARHPRTRELIAQRHFGFSACTALGGDLNDTVGALRTPDGGSSSILQHGNVGNIVDADGQQRREGLFVGTLKVDVGSIVLEDFIVDHNQRLGATVQRRHTTQAHRRTGTEVTRVRDDIETGNTTLQGFVGRGEGHTFDLGHAHRLL